ncbi:MAG: phosphoribosylanthranilate isomerase [Deltaproteobacteria bacterium]|nr:phosphoribosylanthranilate isomerase [Deltaproteobacteria bacterium]
MSVRPPAKLKICGVTHLDDVDACLAHGVDAIGLNLWPRSPRALTVAQALPLVHRARQGRPTVQLVGVVVDPDPASLREQLAVLQLDAVQLHGDAAVDGYGDLGVPYVWVLRGTPPLDAVRLPAPAPAWILLDAKVPHYGGQGVTTDWSWARGAVERLSPAPVWLAGGITPDNAAQALQTVGPAGLDVASGAEPKGDPRRKDPAKIAALAAICHNRSAP